MGVVNFLVYVEKALKWTTSVYESNKITEGLASSVYASKDQNDQRDVRYFNHVVSRGCERYEIPCVPTDECSTKGKTTYGISVDLSSFCYNVITDAVGSSLFEKYKKRIASPVRDDPSTVEVTISKALGAISESSRGSPTITNRQMANGCTNKRSKMVDAFSESLCQPLDGAECQTADSDSYEHANESNHRSTICRTDSDGVKTDITLSDSTIDVCAHRCFEWLFNVIGNEVINGARYFTLHYDENATACKWYVQQRRANNAQLRIDNHSRRRIFLDTIKLVKLRLDFEMRRRLNDDLEKILIGFTAEELERAKRKLTETSFISDMSDEKMQLVGNDRVNQRFFSGEGEWKCFYNIHDVECDTADGSEKRRCRWYVFGNDSDIGLGMLLYSSQYTKIHYVSGSKRIFSIPNTRTNTDMSVYKALHFFALSMMGNDYVPRLINESERNIQALGIEVDRMIVSDQKFCKRYVKRLSEPFADIEISSETSLKETTDRGEDTIEFARALAYVFVRFLLAVYEESYGKRNTDIVETKCEDRQDDAEWMAGDKVIDNTSLRCKDGTRRCFLNCFGVFAVRTLWYMSYCLFYKHMDRDRRQTYRTEDGDKTGCSLYVPGLPVKTCFQYHDRRVLNTSQFELTNLVDVRQAIGSLSTATMMRICERKLLDILEYE